MDAILLYEKETGKIQSLIPGYDIDYFLNTQTVNVKNFAPVFDSDGRKIGEKEVDIFDPIMGDYVKVKKNLDPNLSFALISSRTREELLDLEVSEYEYPFTPYDLVDQNGVIIDHIQLWIPPKVKNIKKGIDAEGKVITEQQKRKLLKGYEHTVILTQSEQNFDFSQHEESINETEKKMNLTKLFFDLHENYIIQSNSLVKKTTNQQPTVD